MNVVMIPLARREMFQAARWYDRQGVDLGNRLLDDIRQSLLAIREFAFAFPSVDGTYRRKLLDTFPYALIYRVDGEVVTIVAFANLKRRPGYWRRRKPS
jgi:hypothetical protein